MKQVKFTPPPPKANLIGHRGIAASAPENTQASFRLAAKQGIAWVEFDIRLTKDNKLVIFHDDTLERTTNGSGWVHEHSLKELKKLDAGSWFSPRFSQETIPHFSEMIPEFHKLGLFLNIELKVPPKATQQHCDALSSALIDDLLNNWPSDAPQPLVSSFDWVILASIRERLPQVPIGFLHENCSAKMIEMVANTQNSALHCDHESLSDDMIALCQEHAIPLLAYTVNHPEIARNLINSGVYGLFSDDPQRLLNPLGLT
ncbi:MAG: glycerophosphoryl diester phosphodiesterase [Proteobacteria bacterium]|nr:glycerophosphoryl diester phosphodiesterase [Pseudomonadota bacterium]